MYCLGIIAIQLSRVVVVFGICPLIGLRDKNKKIELKYQILMFWGGLRGAVPLALVFSPAAEPAASPADYPDNPRSSSFHVACSRYNYQ